jgi:Ca2+-binding RTX toxin-like protein
LAVVVISLVAVPAQRASATVTCAFDSGNHTDTVVLRNDTRLTLEVDGNDLDVNGTPCGTVTTVDTVNVDMGVVSGALLTFDVAAGQFAPGFTGSQQHDPAAEILFSVTRLGPATHVAVVGSNGADKFAVGDRTVFPGGRSVTGIDLNGFADSARPTEDVVLHGQAAQIALSGHGGDDVLTGGGSGRPRSGPTNVQLILSDGPGADAVTGGSGNDIIDPQEGRDPGDTFSGGRGYDFFDAENWHQGITVSLDGAANDGADCPATCDDDNVRPDIEELRGTQLRDVLTGTVGPQTIEGLNGDNRISGGAGDDVLVGGSRTDTFHGGPGFDTVSYAYEGTSVSVTLDGVANDGEQSERDNVEPDVERVFGGAGSDRLVGDSTANTLIGGDGNDILNGGPGNDTLDGGGEGFGPDGSDVFLGGSGTDTVLEDSPTGNLSLSIDGVANDGVVGDPPQGVDNIHTDVENVTGGLFDDRIVGNSAANVLTGGSGDDTLVGGGGDDVLLPGPGTDTLNGGPGKDTASYADMLVPVTVDLLAETATSSGDDSLAGIERAQGSPLDDHLIGSQRANTLHGGSGDDSIKGLGGKDLLFGGPGNDSIDGGPGTDTCLQGMGTGPETACEHT